MPAYVSKDGALCPQEACMHARTLSHPPLPVPTRRRAGLRTKHTPALARLCTRARSTFLSPSSLSSFPGSVRPAPPPWYTPAGFAHALATLLTTLAFFVRTLFSTDAAAEYRRWSLGRGNGRGGGPGGPGGRRGGQVFGLGQLKSVTAVPGGCKSCAGG